MLFAARPRPQVKAGKCRFLVDEAVFPQTLSVLRTRAAHLDIDMVVMSREAMRGAVEAGDVFGCMVQYPDANGEVEDLTGFVADMAEREVRTVFAADLMALLVLKSPGAMGADVVVGSSQRFGVPMGYGGPHAAFFAAREGFKRHFPGRIIGVSVDRLGQPALRMALQTREQHIRRDKATSNICTAQSLLAVMASMYAVYHGPEGLRAIAERIHCHTRSLALALGASDHLTVVNQCHFDTLKVHVAGGEDAMKALRARAESKRVNLRYYADGEHIGVSLNERTNADDFATLCSALGVSPLQGVEFDATFFGPTSRTVDYLHHPVFNRYRSETEMMRYIK
ncbi:MAG: glycine dehydrogenase (aminomethyl-transferring), partial [Bacteroidota bacterium]|nr:glycine dehydrogenase (aminomethyl-transferring) [Bacteroidota bacterium]